MTLDRVRLPGWRASWSRRNQNTYPAWRNLARPDKSDGKITAVKIMAEKPLPSDRTPKIIISSCWYRDQKAGRFPSFLGVTRLVRMWSLDGVHEGLTLDASISLMSDLTHWFHFTGYKEGGQGMILISTSRHNSFTLNDSCVAVHDKIVAHAQWHITIGYTPQPISTSQQQWR